VIDRDVDLRVGEKTYTLSPTLDAMRKINRALGSVVQAAERARSLDFDALVTIIAAGAGISGKSDALASEVFEAGVVNVVGPVADFLGVLLDPTGAREGDAPGK
jgi:hypothetical protein